uniref:Zinc finger GRF-type domain-containing protein n=2 Tax=Quercus lobata TaxID=97700 RepID=A0A7N2LG41_QUELO
MDQCMVRMSLKLHNFGRRFYGCRHWKPDSDQHCKSFKWLDGNTCRRGAETTPIVIAKFTRLEAEAAIAKNNETDAHAMLTEALQRERAAKRIVEKARVAQRMVNDRAHKYKTALVISWLIFAILLVFLRMSSEFGLRQMCLP